MVRCQGGAIAAMQGSAVYASTSRTCCPMGRVCTYRQTSIMVASHFSCHACRHAHVTKHLMTLHRACQHEEQRKGVQSQIGATWRRGRGGEGGTSWVHFASAVSPPGSVHSSASQNAHFQDGVCSFSCRTEPTSQQMTRLGNSTMLHGGIRVQACCQKQRHCSRCLCTLSRCTQRMTLPSGHCLMGWAGMQHH